MDSLGEKNDRTRCLFFSSGGTRLVSWPSYVPTLCPNVSKCTNLLPCPHQQWLEDNIPVLKFSYFWRFLKNPGNFFSCPLSNRRSGNKSFTPRTEKQTSCAVIFFGQRIHFLGQKSKVFIHWSLPFFQDPDNPANKSLFAGLIRQISCYLPD